MGNAQTAGDREGGSWNGRRAFEASPIDAIMCCNANFSDSAKRDEGEQCQAAAPDVFDLGGYAFERNGVH